MLYIKDIHILTLLSFLHFLRCGPFLKYFVEFVTILFLFYVSFFDFEACGILALNQGSNSHLLH